MGMEFFLSKIGNALRDNETFLKKFRRSMTGDAKFGEKGKIGPQEQIVDMKIQENF
jgi:hypothetical protein